MLLSILLNIKVAQKANSANMLPFIHTLQLQLFLQNSYVLLKHTNTTTMYSEKKTVKMQIWTIGFAG